MEGQTDQMEYKREQLVANNHCPESSSRRRDRPFWHLPSYSGHISMARATG